MSISLKQIKSKKVASLDEGRMLGSVQGVYLDESANQLKSIQLSQSVWGGEQRWIRVEAIKRIGVDLIYVANERAVRTGTPEGRSLDSLLGMSISSKDGKVMGNLEDFKIASRLGKIIKIKTHANEFIAVDSQELVIGKDVILVQAKATALDSRPKASGQMVDALRRDLAKRTSKVIARGEKLVKKTSKAVKKILEGQEADLRGKAKKTAKQAKKMVRKAAAKKAVIGKKVNKAVTRVKKAVKPALEKSAKKSAKKKAARK